MKEKNILNDHVTNFHKSDCYLLKKEYAPWS